MHHLLLIALVGGLCLAGALCMASPGVRSIRDALMKLSVNLPASTAAVASAKGFDVGGSSGIGVVAGDFDLLLTAPALTTSQLPDGKTMTYSIVVSANADMSSPTQLYPSLIVQTGAGGAGAAAATFRAALPSLLPGTGSRYVGFTVTPSASGTGDASGAVATLEALF